MTKRYEHLFSLGFSVESDTEDGSELNPEDYRAAVMRRTYDIAYTADPEAWREAVGCPIETEDRDPSTYKPATRADALAIVLESAAIRRDQWQTAADGQQQDTPEFHEAGRDEAQGIANMIDGAMRALGYGLPVPTPGQAFEQWRRGRRWRSDLSSDVEGLDEHSPGYLYPGGGYILVSLKADSPAMGWELLIGNDCTYHAGAKPSVMQERKLLAFLLTEGVE